MADHIRQRGSLTLTINDAKEYFKTEPDEGNERQSQTITLCGLQWKMHACREEDDDGVAWLAVYVTGSKQQAEKWRCSAACFGRVHSSLPDDKACKFSVEFDDHRPSWGEGKIITIPELLKPSNGYLKSGKIAIVCSLTASLPLQCEALEGLRGEKRRCTDVKIVIGDRHLYANKGILAVSCEYFDALFFGDFADRNKDEFLLQDVDFDDFAQFLKLLHPPYDAIDGENIAAVMPLADRFGAKFILEKCKHFLVDEMPVTDAIPILDKCGLSDLKQQLLECASRSELLDLADEEVVETLGRDTMASILKEHRRRSSQP